MPAGYKGHDSQREKAEKMFGEKSSPCALPKYAAGGAAKSRLGMKSSSKASKK